jgi:hypothetical protein
MNNLEIITLKKENITDFARERNALLTTSKAEWVLFLDNDEVASPELMTEIRNLLKRGSLVNGYYIKRKIVFLGKEIGEDKVLRLGRRDAGKWKRAVHEVWNVGPRTGTLDNYIIHNTATNLNDYIEKMNRYSTIHAMENRREGKKSNLFKIIVYPKLKFIQNFLQGRGFVFSLMQSFHSFLGWVKLWELQRN